MPSLAQVLKSSSIYEFSLILYLDSALALKFNSIYEFKLVIYANF